MYVDKIWNLLRNTIPNKNRAFREMTSGYGWSCPEVSYNFLTPCGDPSSHESSFRVCVVFQVNDYFSFFLQEFIKAHIIFSFLVQQISIPGTWDMLDSWIAGTGSWYGNLLFCENSHYHLTNFWFWEKSLPAIFKVKKPCNLHPYTRYIFRYILLAPAPKKQELNDVRYDYTLRMKFEHDFLLYDRLLTMLRPKQENNNQ